MNYTDTLINSLTESEAVAGTNFDKTYNWWCNVYKDKTCGKEAWDLILSWITLHPNWSFKEFRDNTNINTLAKKPYNSLTDYWNEIFDLVESMLKAAIRDENINLATTIYEKAMEMVSTACTYQCKMNVSSTNKNNAISSLNDSKKKLDSLVFTNNNLQTILNNAMRYAKRDQVYRTFNFNKLEEFAKRYNLGNIDINNECLVKVVKEALLENPRFMQGEINETDISMAAATMYLTILAALNIFSAFEGILKDSYKCFVPDNPQPYFKATWLNGLTGNIKVGSDQDYYNLKFNVAWYKELSKGTSEVSYNAYGGFLNLFERDYTANTFGRSFKFSDLLCELYVISTNSSKHDYKDEIRGAYNINLFKQSIEHLIKDIKLQAENKANEI